jgi:hypothetical protein
MIYQTKDNLMFDSNMTLFEYDTIFWIYDKILTGYNFNMILF